MSEYIPNHIPDMNHDGNHTIKDSALFHEMLDEDNTKSQYTSAQVQRNNNGSDYVAGAIAKGILLLIFGGYLILLLKGIFPINGFTSLLALFSAVAFIRSLFL